MCSFTSLRSLSDTIVFRTKYCTQRCVHYSTVLTWIPMHYSEARGLVSPRPFLHCCMHRCMHVSLDHGAVTLAHHHFLAPLQHFRSESKVSKSIYYWHAGSVSISMYAPMPILYFQKNNSMKKKRTWKQQDVDSYRNNFKGAAINFGGW